MLPHLVVSVGVLVILVVIMIFIYEVYDDRPIETNKVRQEGSVEFYNGYEIRRATSLTYKNDTAFVFLALGAQAVQMNCPGAVESLVKYAGWGGDVYFITDRESCFDQKVSLSASVCMCLHLSTITL